MNTIIIDYIDNKGKLKTYETEIDFHIEESDSVKVFNYIYGLVVAHKINVSSLIDFEFIEEDEK